MKPNVKWILIGVVGFLFLCAIISVAIDALGGGGTSQGALPTAQIEPTNETIAAIESTPIPTAESEPTVALLPTEPPTPQPTAVPAQTFAPQTFSGEGDQIIALTEGVGERAAVKITGNEGARFFAVTFYDQARNMVALAVNTTSPYTGVVPMNLNGAPVETIQVQATGPWTIEIMDLYAAQLGTVPGSYTGEGDTVIVFPDKPDCNQARITGNEAALFFAVLGYGENQLFGPDLLVNTTERYEGTVMCPRGLEVLEIKAVGSWTIELQ